MAPPPPTGRPPAVANSWQNRPLPPLPPPSPPLPSLSSPPQLSDDLIARMHNTSSFSVPPLPSFNISHHRRAADSSSSESDFHPSRPRRPAHSRSMSHPFPSLFSSKKKQQPDFSDESDDDTPAPVNSTRPIQPPRGHTRGNMTNNSRDFATGNCMTCNALVRWPRDLRVFKCTVCVTINDLRPVDRPEHRSDVGPKWLRGQVPAPGTSPNSNHAHPSDRPEPRDISVDYTKSLVQRCIRSYLARAVHKTAKDAYAPGATPATPAPSNSNGEPQDTPGSDHARPLQPPPPYSPVSLGPLPAWGPTVDSPSRYLFSEQPTLRPDAHRGASPMRSYSSSYPERPTVIQKLQPEHSPRPPPDASTVQEHDTKRIFKPLEDYIVACLGSFACVNSSFLVRRAAPPVPTSDSHRQPSTTTKQDSRNPEADNICDLDPKLLLLGNFAENGTWWTGDQVEGRENAKTDHRRVARPGAHLVTSRSPHINWEQVMAWYETILSAAESWTSVYDELYRLESFDPLSMDELDEIEHDLLAAQDHVQRILLKATEMLLKRPGRPMIDPDDVRFLLILMANPLLHANAQYFQGTRQASGTAAVQTGIRGGPISGQHSGVIKRIVGLMANSSNACQTHLIAWFARFTDTRFLQIKDFISGYLTYRMLRPGAKNPDTKVDVIGGYIPNMGAGQSAAALHAALGTSRSSKQQKNQPKKKPAYHEDWQIRATSRVMSLLFAANNAQVRRSESHPGDPVAVLRDGIHGQGQRLATSDFYISMIDYADLIADFEAWESKRGKFSFCQYPFLLSMWAKSQILEHDARRQMMSKARDAFFDSILTRKTVTQYLTLDVRRDCLVEDSLTSVSEVIGSGSEDIKKRLRISFKGEEGYDAGGLRKEWFLLLVREVFNPDHGLFTYDEDSQFCYFNPNSFETSDQFFLVGVVLGLAIYNSTILDVALPPFAYRKLMAAAPASSVGPLSQQRPSMTYGLEDLAEFRPRLAMGLKQLLEFEGDVEETFGLDFVVPVEKYGTTSNIPLCPGGEHRPVTMANRREFVALYVKYLLDTAVTRQFEPFKRGFYTVCGGNAFSLFRPEEIELLVRGSDAALDVDALRGVAEYDNWGTKQPDGTEPVLDWFWDTFKDAMPQEQRKLLLFITGSDRVPAMGAALMPIKISCLGDDEDRYPIARTCFNMLSLRRYKTRERLEHMLWTAVHESEGFGLK
ncbi:HECT-domain-containing protein [Plectosphaerella plurivora]|uniref:HECT-type E3 ubiquitin transferase n=1 Tax=Plectosphaerella plurivora TaxID=936078 RepID=A0A9P8V5P9_9PEZI|nr:HECT-domain-containing protein [Plectosphaerella plurivora]